MAGLAGTMTICAILLSTVNVTAAPPQDGAALVARMEAAYAGLKSYSQAVSATGSVVVEGVTRKGTVISYLRYQAPDRLLISIASPAAGRVTAASDGKLQVVYLGKRNAVLRQPAPATLKDFLAGLKTFQIVAVLDPLYFISGNTAARLAGGFESKGTETVNGALCDRVIGTLKPGPELPARSGTITFWIDRKTSLLRKTQLELKGVPLRATASTDPASRPTASLSLSDQSLVETVTKLQVDPQLQPSDLEVRVPPGARPIQPRPSR